MVSVEKFIMAAIDAYWEDMIQAIQRIPGLYSDVLGAASNREHEEVGEISCELSEIINDVFLILGKIGALRNIKERLAQFETFEK